MPGCSCCWYVTIGRIIDSDQRPMAYRRYEAVFWKLSLTHGKKLHQWGRVGMCRLWNMIFLYNGTAFLAGQSVLLVMGMKPELYGWAALEHHKRVSDSSGGTRWISQLLLSRKIQKPRKSG